MTNKYFIIYNIIDIITYIINVTFLTIPILNYGDIIDNNEILIFLFFIFLIFMLIFKIAILIIHKSIIIEHIKTNFIINIFTFLFLTSLYYTNYNYNIYKTFYYMFILTTINLCVTIYLYDDIFK